MSGLPYELRDLNIAATNTASSLGGTIAKIANHFDQRLKALEARVAELEPSALSVQVEELVAELRADKRDATPTVSVGSRWRHKEMHWPITVTDHRPNGEIHLRYNDLPSTAEGSTYCVEDFLHLYRPEAVG